MNKSIAPEPTREDIEYAMRERFIKLIQEKRAEAAIEFTSSRSQDAEEKFQFLSRVMVFVEDNLY